jgi:phosphate:Na+ symporter
LGGLVEKIIPGKPEEEPILRLKHIKQGMYSSPTLSLNLAKQEVLRMIHIVQGMVDEILLVFITKEEVLIEEILQKEEKVNFLRNEISLYLNKIIRDEVSEKIISESFQMMYSVKEFEQMADIVSNSLVPKARQWLSVKHEFSMLGKMEIIAYHEKTQKQLSRAYHIFKSVNLQEIKVIKKKYKEYKKMAIELERQHYLRLKGNVKDSVASSEYHLELIGFMQAIIRHSTNIAKILIQWDAGSSDDKK